MREHISDGLCAYGRVCERGGVYNCACVREYAPVMCARVSECVRECVREGVCACGVCAGEGVRESACVRECVRINACTREQVCVSACVSSCVSSSQIVLLTKINGIKKI